MSRRLIIHGGRQPRELVLVGRMVVGRDPACDVSEADPLLSRRHAEFVAGARDVIVRDLGSRNGILVNGVKKPQAVLHAGDVVQVGHLQVRFEDEPGPFLDRTMAGSDPAAAATRISSAVIRPPRADTPPPPRVSTGAERLSPPPSPDTDRTVRTPTPFPAPRPGAGSSHGAPAPEPMERFFGPGQRFCFEKPARGWLIVPGGGAVLVSLAHDSGAAAVVVARVAGGPTSTTPALAEREVEEILAHDPEATGLDATVASVGERLVVVITYARLGVAGPERVRQYSVPAGEGLYRLTCSAREAEFGRFDAIFAHVAATFSGA